jgi:hypothetical protein
VTFNGYRPLRDHSLAVLSAVNVVVEELLGHRNAIPPELFIKLDTYHADLAAAIEDSAPPPRRLRPIERM